MTAEMRGSYSGYRGTGSRDGSGRGRGRGRGQYVSHESLGASSGSVVRRSTRSSSSQAMNDPNNQPSLPHIGYKMLLDMLTKDPDVMVVQIDGPKFQLDKYLADPRMNTNFEWVQMLTTLFERMLTCLGQGERIAQILIKLPGSTYFGALHKELRNPDPRTGSFRFSLILQTLKIIHHLLNVNPQAESAVSVFTDRIATILPQVTAETEEIKEIKEQYSAIVQKGKLIVQLEQDKSQRRGPSVEVRPPPDDFRLLSIVPSMMEILSPEPVYLRANIVDQGSCYDDSEHYLDIHFRLLREDFLRPLRDGINHYLSKSSTKNADVRIYENVYSLGPKLNSRCGITFGLRLDQKKYGRMQWVNSRRLIFGSLVALTSDHFQTCSIMTVEDRSQLEKELTLYVRPYIHANDVFMGQNTTNLDLLLSSQTLTMIETTSYFEAYRHILNALQKIPSRDFPLAPYILKLSPDITPPNYLTTMTTFDFTPLLVPNKAGVSSVSMPSTRKRTSSATFNSVEFTLSYDQRDLVDKRYRNVPVLDQSRWPSSAELHLNEKQYQALILALTKKVALVQGPPGTGKTFLGVKIAELLLHNRSVWCPSGTENTPILMVCQTNHALDQFLEHIIIRLNMKSGLIRVGGRCKNERILPFSLTKSRERYRESRLIPSHIYEQKREILGKKFASEHAILTNEKTVDMTYQHLTSLRELNARYVILPGHDSSLMLGTENFRRVESGLNTWLGLNTNGVVVHVVEDDMDQLNDALKSTDLIRVDEDKDDEEQDEEERRRDEIDDDEEFFAPARHTPKIKLVTQKHHEEDDDDGEEWRTKVNKQKQKQIIWHLLNNPTNLTDERVQLITGDLWHLTMPERHDLYRYWLKKYREACYKSVSEAQVLFNQAVNAHMQYLQLEDYHILKDAVIVAMTTTCAAKYFDVLQKLACKIVIVEEAAEIFEAHVVTSLSPKCEHLILIGDHVQLRPSPSVYKLAVNYKIDVSLFERFVKNDFPNVRLKIQHRMRPELSALMVHFYKDLENHPSVVTDRPPIIGVKQNLFFISHSHPEEMVAEGNSKQNKFEAEYILALAHYLIKQGYEKSQITILTMYLGQRALISRLMKSSPSSKALQGIRVNVTDSYQGEENEIILLSLVRSNNPTNSIGFLKIHNRICVALSRARCGMYIVGNLQFLVKNEEMWKKIGTTLLKEQALGAGLSLVCVQHPNDDLFVADTAASFGKRPEGGCDKLCNARLPCGHACVKFCHNYSHNPKDCKKKCDSPLPLCQHRCKRSCHFDRPNDHASCQELVEKVVQPCNHTIFLPCSTEPTSDACTYPVPVRLPCDHVVNVSCAVRTSGKFDRVACSRPCQAILACSHACLGTCGECKSGQLHLPCKETCQRQLLCTHAWETSCANNYSVCSSPCETTCVHSKCGLSCGEPCASCRGKCTNRCDHEQCSRLCSEPCDRKPCPLPCLKRTLKCGHPCIGLCGEPCPPLCRFCNKQVVQEYFFGNEDQPSVRFVLLPDCQHLFEVTKLDQEINRFFAEITDGRIAIRFPQCPRCFSAIRRCQRYIPIINQIEIWIKQVKIKQQNGVPNEEMIDQRTDLVKSIQSTYEQLAITVENASNIFGRLNKNRAPINIDQLNYLKNTDAFLTEIGRLYAGAKASLNAAQLTETVVPPVRHLMSYMLKQSTALSVSNYTQQQLLDIQNELRRIRCLVNSLVLDRLLPLTARSSNNQDLLEMKLLTAKSGPFTKKDCQRIDDTFHKSLALGFLSSKNLLAEQALAIVDTLKMEAGRWFVCRHDQVYSIDHTDGTSQYGECPGCASEQPSFTRKAS